MIACIVLLSQISSLLHPLSEPFRSPSSFLLPRPLTTIHNSLPTIFFRITSFADPYPLTSIESHLYKKYPRGVTHSSQPKSSKYPAPVSIFFRIRTYVKHIPNPNRMNTSKTQGLKPFRMNTYEKTGEGEGRNCRYRPGTSLTEQTGSIPDTAGILAIACKRSACHGKRAVLWKKNLDLSSSTSYGNAA